MTSPPSRAATRAAQAAWHGQAVWCVLDTAFGTGDGFLELWRAWLQDARRPARLQLVAIAPHAPERGSLLEALRADVLLAPRIGELQRALFGLVPGFHRLGFEDGRVTLTLAIGPLLAQLRELRCLVDAVLLKPAAPGADSGWDRWSLRALARVCRPLAQVHVAPHVAATAENLLASTGFGRRVEDGPAASEGLQAWRYDPPWRILHPRDDWRRPAPPPAHCTVVGAGLAGAGVAAALARRGWQVSVLDAAREPAAGASGLPVGLMAPAHSRDDAPRSRLVRVGMRLSLQACRRWLREGEDWSLCGALEWLPDADSALPQAWGTEGAEWTHVHDADHLWHATAAWVKPARLVQALLARPGIRFSGGRQVARLLPLGSGNWSVCDADGMPLAAPGPVVLANAGQAVALWNGSITDRTPSLPPSQAVPGSVCWGLEGPEDAAWPSHALRGHGHLIAHVPLDDGRRLWCAGATFGAQGEVERPAEARSAIHDRLLRLAPPLARDLASRFATGAVQLWSGQRCATPDRLPWVGQPDPEHARGLWLCTGMGSRGLSLALLCGELIAARLGAEPLPVEGSLADALDARRARSLLRPVAAPGT